MARSGIEQIAVITDTTCGNPRTDQAVKWNQVQDSLKSVSQRGQTLVSAWGPKVDGNVKPILGGAIQTRQEADVIGSFPTFFPNGVHTHEVFFEQPSFITSGSVSIQDHFVLHTKFVLANGRSVSGIYNGDSYAYESFGKVKITLVNSGGSQVLLHHTTSEYLAIIGGSGITTEAGVPNNGFSEIEKVVTAQLGNTLIPPIGSSFDSKLVFEIDGYIAENTQPQAVDPLTDIRNGIVDNQFGTIPPYLGIAGATFRIFNPAQ